MTVPRSELTSYLPISENQLLAAVARASLHQEQQLVSGASVIEHFAFKRSGHTTRMLRPQLHALVAAKAIEQLSWLERDHVALTSPGRRRLTRALSRGQDLSLPESPQHREWRRKHAQAIECVDADREHADSEAWADMAHRLHVSVGQLSASIHCSREWTEPDDAQRDADPLMLFGVRRRGLGRGLSE